MKPIGNHAARKRWSVVLGISLALNAVGLACIVTGGQPRNRSVQGPIEHSPTASAATNDLPRSPGKIELHVFHWADLVADDLPEYAANLRQLGCPSEVVRAVLADEIRRRYVPLIRRLKRESVKDYWEQLSGVKSSRRDARTPEELAAEEQLNEVYRQYRALHREFGIDEERDRFPDFDGDDVGFLSAENRARLREQDDAMDQLRNTLRSGGVDEDRIREQLRELEAAQDLERRDFLGPDDYTEFTLRRSPHAGVIGNLLGFEATPGERKAIVSLRESAGESVDNNDWQSGLRPLLGEARFAEFQRAQDPAYRDLVEMTAHFGLGETAANEVYAAQRTAEAASDAVRALNLDPDQQLDALADVLAEAGQTLRAQLGDAAYEVYRRHAAWLKPPEGEPGGP